MGTHFSLTHSLCLILTPCLHHMTFEEKSYFAYLLKIVISLPNCNFHVASKIIRSQCCRKASNKNLDALYYRHEWFILLLRLHIHSSYYKAQLCTNNNKAKVFENCERQRGPEAMSEMHSKPGGTDQLQFKASLPTAESVVGKDKSWPLREQL